MQPDSPMIHITSLADFSGHAMEIRPSHVVSMLADDDFPATPESVSGENHLRLTFDDINQPLPGHSPPGLEHLERLIDFGQRWNGNGSLISHCFAGVSRSSAAALILLSQVNPGREREIGALMRARGPHFQPNRLMIEHAEQLLQAGGRLLEALGAMGSAEPLSPWRPVTLPVRLDEA